ncbi:MAG: hypothetical protein ACYSWY_10470 [Planctomycetota bacterium]|jgi:hypothetical protein
MGIEGGFGGGFEGEDWGFGGGFGGEKGGFGGGFEELEENDQEPTP